MKVVSFFFEVILVSRKAANEESELQSFHYVFLLESYLMQINSYLSFHSLEDVYHLA
jgi:hypothetical protein